MSDSAEARGLAPGSASDAPAVFFIVLHLPVLQDRHLDDPAGSIRVSWSG
jgi:hypothetical protein